MCIFLSFWNCFHRRTCASLNVYLKHTSLFLVDLSYISVPRFVGFLCGIKTVAGFNSVMISLYEVSFLLLCGASLCR